ncbi:ARCN1 [Mytilus edulis]|uniref:Coatomer subunit delta n=1 Tax=Mytilus edulis TaxID=6550 RepID=A0A8S3VPZ7_MYTED|nr:ARCN1 [Mytilus edulis]
MVLLAAAVCNKSGKALISRQFVEMTRSRIEGLLAAFPKLMSSGKQHTFVETESIPEYCRNMEEAEIGDQAFSLIFAFDEIVALGYRENVNLAQIRTFTEMDSHEEKVAISVRETQEREAKEAMKKRAKELQQERKEAGRSGKGIGYAGGFGSSSYSSSSSSRDIIEPTPSAETKPSYTSVPSKPSGTGKALKLGSKKKDVDTFVGQLESEGQKVVSSNTSVSSTVAKASTPAVDQDGVHIVMEEKVSLTAGRDGGLQSMEILGMVKVKVNDEQYGRIKVQMINNDKKGTQLQTHPNVDKKRFSTTSNIQLKNPEKPFPLHQDVGVLKWRYTTQDESNMPLSINCWPNETGNGCDVNIEYQLEQPQLELNDVTINIPLPTGVGAPVVGDCDGEYNYDSRKSMLVWSLPVIDASNKSGSLEFSIAGHPDDFFPVHVNFMSKKSYCDLQISDVRLIDGEQPVKYSSEVMCYTDKYEIV